MIDFVVLSLLYSHYFIINALNGTWFSINGTLLDMNESLELTNEAIDECFSHLDKTKLYYTYLVSILDAVELFIYLLHTQCPPRHFLY